MRVCVCVCVSRRGGGGKRGEKGSCSGPAPLVGHAASPSGRSVGQFHPPPRTPTKTTENNTTQHNTQAGAVDDAARLAARLEEVEAAGGPPDELSFGVRVRALLEQGEWEAAHASLLEAEGKGLASHLSYSLLINAAARGGRWRDAVGVLLHMRARGVAVSGLDISSAINACRLAGELPAAMALLRVLDARRRRGRGGREQEERAEEGIDPYQASCGLVLDLLAKRVPPVRGAAARRKRRLPWHCPPPLLGEEAEGEMKEDTSPSRARQRKATPKDKEKRGGGGGGSSSSGRGKGKGDGK
jgi:pentatricopeptide repeat protein